ncbi:MAG: LysM peptidoglycan-binding domain-containing protein, partial [Spirochaetes bacterium]|nr:LysM peptidoglycan-binding domain-containing protein [Spirochaetota bacterium]
IKSYDIPKTQINFSQASESVCQGAIPNNAAKCSNTTQDSTKIWTYVSACSVSGSCEFTCNSGCTWNSSTGKCESVISKCADGTIVGDCSIITKPKSCVVSSETEEGEYYTVQVKDELKGIGKKIYGNDKDWKKIYDQNKEKIGDPNLIYPGQKFIIPR